MLDPGPEPVTVGASGADHSSIQAAVDASPPGTTILIASGNYAEHVVIEKSLTLIGAGPATVVELPAGSSAKGAIEILAATGVRLSDLSVLAAIPDVDGIYIEDSTDIVIESVVASGTGDEGVLGIQNGSFRTRNLGEDNATPREDTRVEWYNNFHIMHPRSVIRVHAFTNVAIVS